MMFSNRPNAITIFLLTLTATFSSVWGNNTEEAGLLFAYALTAGGISFLFWVWYWLEVYYDLRDRHQNIMTRTARLRELEAASHLTPEQAATVPVIGINPEIDSTMDSSMEFEYFLVTPQGRIPLEWLREFIRDSGIVYLRSIGTFSEGTAGYDYATWATNWFVSKGFALPHSGPHPAQWKTEQTKSQVSKLFGVEWELPDLGMGEFYKIEK